MRQGTSGFWVERSADGAIRIGYEDYGVSEFGGGDFERTYSMNKENSQRFVAALEKDYSGTLEDKIEAAFGKSFHDPLFGRFAKSTASNIRPPHGARKQQEDLYDDLYAYDQESPKALLRGTQRSS